MSSFRNIENIENKENKNLGGHYIGVWPPASTIPNNIQENIFYNYADYIIIKNE